MSSRTLERLFPKAQADRLHIEYQLVFKLRDLIRQGKPAKQDDNLSESLKKKLGKLRNEHFEILKQCYFKATDNYDQCKTSDELAIMFHRRAGWLKKNKAHWFNHGALADNRKMDTTNNLTDKGVSQWDYRVLVTAFAAIPTAGNAKETSLHLKLYLTLLKHVFIYDKVHKTLAPERFSQLISQLEALHAESHTLIRIKLPSIIACYQAYLDNCDLSQGWDEVNIKLCNRLLVLCLPPATQRSDTTSSQFKYYLELVKHVMNKGYLGAFPQLLAVIPTHENSSAMHVPFKMATAQGSLLSSCHRAYQRELMRQKKLQVLPQLTSLSVPSPEIAPMPIIVDIAANDANQMIKPAPSPDLNLEHDDDVSLFSGVIQTLVQLETYVERSIGQLGKLASYFNAKPKAVVITESAVTPARSSSSLSQLFQGMRLFSLFTWKRTSPPANEATVQPSANDADQSWLQSTWVK